MSNLCWSGDTWNSNATASPQPSSSNASIETASDSQTVVESSDGCPVRSADMKKEDTCMFAVGNDNVEPMESDACTFAVRDDNVGPTESDACTFVVGNDNVGPTESDACTFLVRDDNVGPMESDACTFAVGDGNVGPTESDVCTFTVEDVNVGPTESDACTFAVEDGNVGPTESDTCTFAVEDGNVGPTDTSLLTLLTSGLGDMGTDECITLHAAPSEPTAVAADHQLVFLQPTEARPQQQPGSRFRDQAAADETSYIETQLPLETRLAVRNALLPPPGPRKLNSGGADSRSPQQLACTVCGKQFTRHNDLKNHVSLHLGIKEFVCDVCGRRFSNKSNFYRHLRIHTGERPYVCPVCKKRFTQTNALSVHMIVHSSAPYDCPSCQQKFDAKTELVRHLRLTHKSTAKSAGDGRFHCGVCGGRFSRRRLLTQHLLQHSGDPLLCGVCHDTFPTVEAMIRHPCMPPAYVNGCRSEGVVSRLKRSRHAVSLESDESSTPDPLALPTGRIDAVFSDSTETVLDFTTAATMKPDESSNNNFVKNTIDSDLSSVPSSQENCPLEQISQSSDCQVSFSNEKTAEPSKVASLYQKADHVDEVIDAVVKVKTTGGEGRTPADTAVVEDAVTCGALQCDICSRRFSRLHNLRQHQALHDASLRRYACPHCPRRFAWQQTRDRHMAVHTGGTHVACDICRRVYTKDSLLGHMRRIHVGDRRHVCSVCQKTFHQRSELVAHARSHTDQKPFMCSWCGREFKHKSHLLRHERWQHESRRCDDATAVRRRNAVGYSGRRPTADTAVELVEEPVTRGLLRNRDDSAPLEVCPPMIDSSAALDTDILQDSLTSACIPLEDQDSADFTLLVDGAGSHSHVVLKPLQLMQPLVADDASN